MIKNVKLTSVPTETGWRVEATETIRPEILEGVRLWAQREAEARRLFTIQIIEPGEFGCSVIAAHRINYNPTD